MPSPTKDAVQCIALSDYDAPSLPTQRVMSQTLLKLIKRFTRKKDKEEISSDELHSVKADILDKLAAPPACQPIFSALDSEVLGWLESSPEREQFKLIILAPCDDNDVLSSWGQEQGIEILNPPNIADLILGKNITFKFPEKGAIIIPRLESWIVRTPTGIATIRRLLSEMHASNCKVIIGCNAFAWEFMRKSVSADHFLPEPITFPPFDGPALRDWFANLSKDQRLSDITFTHQSSGADIFDMNNSTSNTYFQTLAARSLGVPWIAWNLWRSSLKTQAQGQQNSEDPHTLWVSSLEEFSLPGSKSEMSLLVLQALLIHGRLRPEDLQRVLPNVGPISVVPLLTRAGIIRKENGWLSCRPEAYPAIRKGLFASGFPMGTL